MVLELRLGAVDAGGVFIRPVLIIVEALARPALAIHQDDVRLAGDTLVAVRSRAGLAGEETPLADALLRVLDHLLYIKVILAATKAVVLLLLPLRAGLARRMAAGLTGVVRSFPALVVVSDADLPALFTLEHGIT